MIYVSGTQFPCRFDCPCHCHYYYDRDKVIKTRNGSDQSLKQQVWGVQDVDELVLVPPSPVACEHPEKIKIVAWATQPMVCVLAGVGLYVTQPTNAARYSRPP